VLPQFVGATSFFTTICSVFFLINPKRPSSLQRKYLRPKLFGVMANYLIEQLDEVEPTPCPCGLAKRAFVGEPGAVASLHEVDIKRDSAVHYHKRMTEIYLVLEGEGHMELTATGCRSGP
jgi:mannose-6-phosphate isomerase-like protein (cupin superfamily)